MSRLYPYTHLSPGCATKGSEASRAIVVRVTPSREWALDGRVFAQCWKPFGERRHICAEEIEITSAETALADVPSVVLPLPVADLPVVLWCRDLRLMDVPGFAGIASLANRIVFDGAGFDRIQAIHKRLDVATLTPRRDLTAERLQGERRMRSA